MVLLLLASLLLCNAVAWATPQPATPQPATVNPATVNPAPSKPAAVPANAQTSDLLAAILQTPQPKNATTPLCVTQTRCSNGLWLGCNGYTDPTCETYRNCVMCDGVVYRCPSGFCPY
jgi:hypothetical protein